MLVIDDNRAIHDDFRKILSPSTSTAAALDATETALFGEPVVAVQQAQFVVESAYQGQEGAQVVKQAIEKGLPFAVAFVDVRMPPGWDGVETTQKLWELDPDLQVVLCTAYSDYSWGEMFEKLGHRDGLLILKKPFDAVEALQLAYALTGKWALHRASRRRMEELESRVAERTGELQQTNRALQTEVVEHQRSEATLRDSEEKFRQMAENISDVFWVDAPDMRTVHYVSPAYEQIWGRSVNDLYANPQEWSDAILPEDRGRVAAEFSRLALDAPSVSAEYQISRPDGTVRWILSRGFQVRDGAGTLTRLTGVASDITERKQAEEATQRSRKRLRDLIDGVGPSMFVGLMTPQGIVVEANRPALEAAGLKPEDVLGKPFEETSWWAHSPSVQERLRAGIAKAALGEASRYDAQVRGADGQLIDIDFSLQPLRDDTGEVVFIVPSASVITERKQAEIALRESEARTRLLIQSSSVGLWDWNLVTDEVFFSPEWKGQLGYTDAELPSRLDVWESLLHPEDREPTLALVKDYLEGRRADYDVEFRLRHKDGSWRWIFTRASLTRDASGKPVRMMGGHIDVTERKRSENALRESERRFSDMLRNLELVSVMVDRDARITYCNDYLLRLTGWQRDEVIGRDCFEVFVPPEIIDDMRAFNSQLLANQPGAWHHENEILTRAGERRIIRWNNSVLRSAAGDVIGTASIGEDITERKRTEAALLSSEARTKAIVQSSLDGVVTIDHDGRILEFNPAAESVFGFRCAEVVGREMAEVIVPPALRDKHRQGLMRYLATGEARVLGKRIEILAMNSEGREFPVELAITRLGAEEPPTFTGFIRDISERKRAERQLTIQHAISRVLAESSTAEEATPRMLQIVCETFGWDVSELWSLDSREGVLHCAEIWSATDATIDEFKAASRHMTFARDVGLPGRVWASGQPTWISGFDQDGDSPRALAAKQAGLRSAFAFPIMIGSGVSGVIECFSREAREPDQDMLRTFTVLGSQIGQFFERRRLEDQLFQAQKLETVGKLAGGIAHEFNSILTAIIGQSELMLADLPAGNPLVNNATEISKAAGRAATLTRQLLAYGSKQFLQPETLDLNRVIASMSGIFDHLMGGDIVTHLVPAADLRAVKADAGQLEQVIMNMAINARDAMPNGGQLTLETADISLDQDSVGRYPELRPGHYVLLAISDTGAGMSAEVQARIFEPFFTTKGVGEGSGLGLSTCYGIVKQSGGHISVYSESGRGTTFKIYLPQAGQQPKPAAQRPDSPELPRGTETILLVEDDPALCEMAATLLRRLGYKVLAAANGIEALSLKQRLDTGHVDLLFTDVVMPHMSGRELADRVRALNPHTKILFTSAYTEHAIVHQGVLSKGVTLLQKPFTPSALARKIRDVLDAVTPPLSVGPAHS